MDHTTIPDPSPMSLPTPDASPGERRKLIEVEVETTATPSAVWALLADVTTWTLWAGFKEATYDAPGNPAPDGIGAVRRFRAGPLSSRETVLAFEPDRHLAYDYVGSLPYRWYRGDVTLEAIPAGTRITWHAEFVARRRFMGPVLRAFMTVVLRNLVKRLAVAAAEDVVREGAR